MGLELACSPQGPSISFTLNVHLQERSGPETAARLSTLAPLLWAQGITSRGPNPLQPELPPATSPGSPISHKWKLRPQHEEEWISYGEPKGRLAFQDLSCAALQPPPARETQNAVPRPERPHPSGTSYPLRALISPPAAWPTLTQ